MRKELILPFLFLILLVFLEQWAFSDTPQLISFQGRIVDANGQPLADGNYSMTFKIFNVSAGGAALWTETQGTVAVANGLFSVLLGSVTSLSSLGFNENYWLEITVGASTYSPRQQIASSAYALNIPDLRVTTGKIAPGTAGQLLMSNATPATTWTSMSGDATINSSGVVAIAADAVALGTDTTGNYAGSNAEGGSATNAFACSADGTCEIQSGIQSISNNSITIDALNTGAASTITLTNSNGTYAANVNVADGALQVGGTSVIDSSRNVANVVNFTNTGNTTLGDAGADALTVYPNTMNLTGNVGKTIDVGSGAVDTTLTVTNSGAGTANLSVEGSVTASSFSGSASNALACSGDATCETNAITTVNDITVSSGSITVSAGNLSVSTGNVTIAGTITTGIGATEIYQMNQAVRTSDAVTFAGITNSGNTTLGDAGADTLTLYSTVMDWNNVDEDKTIQVGSGITDRTLTLTNPDATGKANLTVEGSVTATSFSGSASNALACSGDATCETNAISATGNTYPSANNTYTLGTAANQWSTIYGVAGTFSGALSSTTLNTGQGAYELYAMDQDVLTTSNVTHANLTSTGNTQIGDAAADTLTVYPNTTTLTGNVGKTIDVGPGASATTLTITNSGAGVASLSVEGGLSSGGNIGINNVLYSNTDIYLDLDEDNNTANSLYVRNGANTNVLTLDESGNLTNTGTITTPGYISITGAQNTSGNLRFSAANPYISASSYFVAPGGAYFNSGTVYTEAAIQARGGISNDSANCGGYLCLNEDTLVTGTGWLRVDGDEGLYFESYGGGWRMIDTTWIRAYNDKYVYTGGWMRADSGFDKSGTPIIKKVTFAANSGWVTCGTSGWSAVACLDGSGYVQPPNNCSNGGSMICMWTSGL